jgi:hypothetical protein
MPFVMLWTTNQPNVSKYTSRPSGRLLLGRTTDVNPLLDWAWLACLVRARVIRPVLFRADCPAEVAHLVHALGVVLLVVVRQAAVQVAAPPGCPASVGYLRRFNRRGS